MPATSSTSLVLLVLLALLALLALIVLIVLLVLLALLALIVLLVLLALIVLAAKVEATYVILQRRFEAERSSYSIHTFTLCLFRIIARDDVPKFESISL